jgi:hypothetical protein
MNQRIKAQWVDALTSGKYQQSAGHLRSGQTYCCLGVLCDLHRLAQAPRQRPRWRRSKWAGETGAWTYFGYESILPLDVIRWAGLLDAPNGAEGNPMVGEAQAKQSLMGLNDSRSTFEQIAKLIDRYL